MRELESTIPADLSDPAPSAGKPLFQRTIQLLSTELTVRTNHRALFGQLDYLVPRAEHDMPISVRSRIDVMWSDGAFRISGTGFTTEYRSTLPDAFDQLAAKVHDATIAAYPGATQIHAASLVHAGRTVLLIGPKRVGKTTLAAHLLLEGFDVVGDEMVLLETGRAAPLPRPFYLREAALALLPDLKAACRDAPFTNSPCDGRLVALDPTMLGRRWRIGHLPVSTCIYIEPRHYGRSFIAPCSPTQMVQRILPQSIAPQDTARAWIAEICQIVAASAIATLELGDLGSATVALRDTLR